MPRPKLDRPYELQLDLGWAPDFSQAAVKEYMRYLQLRAKEQDFHDCKLPPSRLVGMVWSLHRQWTNDYQNTCSKLGGFIHHFPPAMRLSASREQAYSNTFHIYKTQFCEEPPAAYWGAPIYRPNPAFTARYPTNDTPRNKSLSPNSNNQNDHPNNIHQQYDDNFQLYDDPDACNQLNNRSEFNHRKRPHNDTDLSDLPPSDSNPNLQYQRNSPYNHQPEELIDQQALDPYLHERRRYVLRPLRPGEKRRRGRPSFSEYVTFEEFMSIREELEKEELMRSLPQIRQTDNNNREKPRQRKYGLPKQIYHTETRDSLPRDNSCSPEPPAKRFNLMESPDQDNEADAQPDSDRNSSGSK